MSTIIVNAGAIGIIINGADRVDVGRYLKAYDPDAMDGYGEVDWTADRAQAKRFDNVADAFNEWRRPSTVRPIRDDGKPNRPLTAYSISFEDVPE